MINILVKNRLKALLGSMVSKGRDGSAVKAGKGRIVLVVLLYLFVFLSFAGISTSLAVIMGAVLIPIGASWLYFAIFIIAALSIIFVFSIFETKSELFECKDNDLLLSMPIRPRDIVASRVAVVLVYNYIEALIIMLPCIIVYAVFAKEPIGVIGAILVSLLIPLLATALSSVCGYGVAVLSKLFKKKTLINVVIYLAFFAAYMVGYEFLFDGFEKFLTDAENAGTVAYIPALYYIGASALLEPLSFAIVAIVSFAAAAVSYYVISKSYIRIVTSEYTPKKTYKEKEASSRSQLSALVHKELSSFFSSATYILNGGLGYLFAVALGVLLLVKSELVGVVAAELFLESADPVSNLIPILISALILISSIGVISASSLSLEGKRLWIVKTMPIDARTLLLSKSLPQFIIATPPMLIASVLLIISTKATFANSIFIVLIPLLANAFFALFGTVMNVALPKFDFRNDAEVIKQSLAVFIVMMAGMFISFLALGVAFVLTIVAHPLLSSVALALLFLALAILMYFILTRVSVRVYEKLDA